MLKPNDPTDDVTYDQITWDMAQKMLPALAELKPDLPLADRDVLAMELAEVFFMTCALVGMALLCPVDWAASVADSIKALHLDGKED